MHLGIAQQYGREALSQVKLKALGHYNKGRRVLMGDETVCNACESTC